MADSSQEIRPPEPPSPPAELARPTDSRPASDSTTSGFTDSQTGAHQRTEMASNAEFAEAVSGADDHTAGTEATDRPGTGQAPEQVGPVTGTEGAQAAEHDRAVESSQRQHAEALDDADDAVGDVADDTAEDTNPNPYDRLTPDQQQAAKQELIDDSNKDFPLSDENAEAALRSGPPGTTPEVAGPGGQGADVLFHDGDGDIVARTETKSVEGGPNSFNRAVSHAASQVEYDGQVRIQVPAGTDTDHRIAEFQQRRTDESLERYRNVEVVTSDPDGNVLGSYDLGTRLPQ